MTIKKLKKMETQNVEFIGTPLGRPPKDLEKINDIMFAEHSNHKDYLFIE